MVARGGALALLVMDADPDDQADDMPDDVPTDDAPDQLPEPRKSRLRYPNELARRAASALGVHTKRTDS